MNASDSRNKSDTKYKQGVAGKLSNRVKELVTNTAISLGGVADTKPRRQVLIMDEVDGMSGAHLAHSQFFQGTWCVQKCSISVGGRSVACTLHTIQLFASCVYTLLPHALYQSMLYSICFVPCICPYN